MAPIIKDNHFINFATELIRGQAPMMTGHRVTKEQYEILDSLAELQQLKTESQAEKSMWKAYRAQVLKTKVSPYAH